MFEFQHSLEQLREIRARVLENQLFGAYSAMARALGSGVAFVTALIIHIFEMTAEQTFWSWGVCAFVVGASNFATALRNMRREKTLRMNRLGPLLDPLPALFVGGVLTWWCYQLGYLNPLYGIWMLLFGLVNLSSRHRLALEIWQVGWFYILSGSFLLVFLSDLPFQNPWPMAAVFVIGELGGAYAFYRTRRELGQDENAKGVN